MAQSLKEKIGNKRFETFSFQDAIKKYDKMKDKDASIYRKLAEAYFNIGEYKKSEDAYKSFVKKKGRNSEDVYKYASVLAINEKYDESEKWMETFYSTSSKDIRAKLHHDNKGFYKTLLKDKNNLIVKNLDYNTFHSDFSPVYYKDKLVFTSSNPNGRPLRKNSNWNNLPFLDLYIATLDENFQLKEVEKFFNKREGLHRGGSVSFNKSGNYSVYTQNAIVKDGLYGLKLFSSKLVDGKWSKGEEMVFNKEGYSAGHGTLSPDGNTIVFVSNQEGGKGATDLYISTKDGGSWSEPKNLGNKVNTPGKELFPYFHESGMLFFASDGLLGIGGLDIFTVKLENTSVVGEVRNMGVPVNSSHDDFSLILSADEKSGFFSSNRESGKGSDDIYQFTVLDLRKKIEGIAYDDYGNILSNTAVILKDESNEFIDSIITDQSGTYSFEVDANLEFQLTGTKEMYEEGTNKASTKTEEEVVKADLTLKLIPALSLLYKVYDRDSKELMDGVSLKVKNNADDQTFDFISAGGEHIQQLKEYKLNDSLAYSVLLTKEGYLTEEINIDILLAENKQYEATFEMQKLDVGTDLAKLKGVTILFDYNSHVIKDETKKELDKFVKLMNDNPTIVVELSSHTDCRGTDIYNTKLSDRRAKASAEYVKKRISSPSRVSGRGYGSSKPTVTKPCGDYTDEEHADNRRTEFRIVKK